MSLSKLWEIAKDGDAWHAAVHGVAKSQTLSNLNNNNSISYLPTKITFSQPVEDSSQIALKTHLVFFFSLLFKFLFTFIWVCWVGL